LCGCLPAASAHFYIMRALLQRVQSASVSIQGATIAQIGPGLVILLGVGPQDGDRQARFLVDKIAHLRIFEDGEGKMNRSILDVGGEVIVVSQFTLYADTSRGRRPSFTSAAAPKQAQPVVETFADLLAQSGIATQTGQFGAHMLVNIANDGPVTIWLEAD